MRHASVRASLSSVCSRGTTTAEKLRGTKVWVQTPRPARGRAGDECGRGSRCGGPGYYPREIFENSDAKSCILVASPLISGLPWTCIYKSWGTNTLLVPQPKSWGTSLPRSPRLLRLWFADDMQVMLHSLPADVSRIVSTLTDCFTVFTDVSHLWPARLKFFGLDLQPICERFHQARGALV